MTELGIITLVVCAPLFWALAYLVYTIARCEHEQ